MQIGRYYAYLSQLIICIDKAKAHSCGAGSSISDPKHASKIRVQKFSLVNALHSEPLQQKHHNLAMPGEESKQDKQASAAQARQVIDVFQEISTLLVSILSSQSVWDCC